LYEGTEEAVRIPWTANKVGSPICQSGCQEVAKAIQARIGGTIEHITPKGRFAQSLGRVADAWGTTYANPAGAKGVGWGDHYVVVKEGRAYDLLTGPRGEPVEAYKVRFKERDAINFGWERKK
jgi:hypothetical protein